MKKPKYTLQKIGKSLFSIQIENKSEIIELYKKLQSSEFLTKFFTKNWNQFYPFFKINIHKAIELTKEESEKILKFLINNKDNSKELDNSFQKLSQNYKGKPPDKRKLNPHNMFNINSHYKKSWIRIYAIKLPEDIFIITGGAIKTTQTMQDGEWTNKENKKLEDVYQFLLKNKFNIEKFVAIN